MPKSPDFTDRVTGMLVGAAIGDALGAPYEFKAGGTFKVAREYRRGVFGTGPGEPTDDSTLVRLHAEAWVETKGQVNSLGGDNAFRKAYVEKLIKWRNSGPPDIGGQTSSAISNWTGGSGPCETKGSGNGSLMAVAPIAAVFKTKALAQKAAAEFANITHCNGEARWANQRIIGVEWDLLHGEPPHPYVSELPEWVQRDGGHMGFSLVGADYALESLEMISGHKPGWFKRHDTGMRQTFDWLIEQGGDTDTNAAIAGAVLGAYVGFDRMNGDPQVFPLVANLHGLTEWIELARKLAELGQS